MANAEGVPDTEEPMALAPQADDWLVKPIFGYINRWTEIECKRQGKITLPPMASALVYVSHCAELPAPKYEFVLKESIEGLPQKKEWEYKLRAHIGEPEKKQNNTAWGYEVSIKIDVIVNSEYYQTYLSSPRDHSSFRKAFCIHYCKAIYAKHGITLNAVEAQYATYSGSERVIAAMNRNAKHVLIYKKLVSPQVEKEIQKKVKNNKMNVLKNRPGMQSVGIKEFGKLTITRLEQNLRISFPVEYEGMDLKGVFLLNIKIDKNIVRLVSDDGVEVFSVRFQFRFDQNEHRLMYDEKNKIITLSLIIKI